MRRKQFGQLQSDLRAELGRNNDPGVRAADAPQIKQVLSRVYEELYGEYDWPFLNVFSARIPLSAGERYYDFPDNIDLENTERVVVWYNGKPVDLTRGIDFEQYALYDSDSDDRADPALRWDVRYDTADAIEIWPIPASDNLEIQVKGRQKFSDLVDDEDLCLLDDVLVVLSAAAEIAPDDKTIKRKLFAREKRLGAQKGRTKGGTKSFSLKGASPARRMPPIAVIVPS